METWTSGVAYRQEFCDGLALGPLTETGPADRSGYRVTYTLDDLWLPRGASIGSIGPVSG